MSTDTNNLPPAIPARRASWEQRILQLREEEWHAHVECMQAARECLKRYRSGPNRAVSLRDIARLLELASKLGRLATGADSAGALSSYEDPQLLAELEKQLDEVFCESIEGPVSKNRSRSGPRNHQSSIIDHKLKDPRQFFRDGRAAGCPRDQLLSFASKGIWLQPRQLVASAAARECDKSDGPAAIGYGGARGGGKSHWLLAQMGGDDCQRVDGLKCLLLRKVGKANLESFEDLRRRVFPKLPHIFTSSKGHLSFDNGSRIIAGHFQHESDIDSYLGLEYDIIGIEEATTLTWRKYNDIRTCCRTSKPNWRPRIYCTTNPGGVGHAWFRREFIDPYLQSKSQNPKSEIELVATQSEGDRPRHGSVFVPARVTDNAFVNREYKTVLERLSGWQKRAWLHGDWDIAAGQFFTTFRREVHVVNSFDEGRALEWFAALDYGYTHYTVVLLGCKDGDGNLYILDEHAERFWLPERHAKAIHDMLQRHNLYAEKLRWFVAGTDCFSAQHDGTTIAQQYQKFGFKLRPANTDRVQGWAEMLRLFGDADNGLRPRLIIHQRCGRLIDCLPNLQHDPHRPEDILKIDVDDDGNGGDDPADAARYLIHYKPPVIKQVRLRGF